MFVLISLFSNNLKHFYIFVDSLKENNKLGTQRERFGLNVIYSTFRLAMAT